MKGVLGSIRLIFLTSAFVFLFYSFCFSASVSIDGKPSFFNSFGYVSFSVYLPFGVGLDGVYVRINSSESVFYPSSKIHVRYDSGGGRRGYAILVSVPVPFSGLEIAAKDSNGNISPYASLSTYNYFTEDNKVTRFNYLISMYSMYYPRSYAYQDQLMPYMVCGSSINPNDGRIAIINSMPSGSSYTVISSDFNVFVIINGQFEVMFAPFEYRNYRDHRRIVTIAQYDNLPSSGSTSLLPFFDDSTGSIPIYAKLKVNPYFCKQGCSGKYYCFLNLDGFPFLNVSFGGISGIGGYSHGSSRSQLGIRRGGVGGYELRY